MTLILSLVMLSAFALTGGALFLWRRDGAGKQALLMLLLAAIMIANVLIWTLPDNGGAALIDSAPKANP
jgi:hypothetical protein